MRPTKERSSGKIASKHFVHMKSNYWMPLTLQWEIVYSPYKKGGIAGIQAYCMKCRVTRERKDAKAITMKNGRLATQGACPVCGTKMFRIGQS